MDTYKDFVKKLKNSKNPGKSKNRAGKIKGY